MNAVYLYLVQRATAFVLAPLVLVHIGLILYAVRGGVSAEEILARTQGHVGWALFYGVFVIAASLHAGVGVHTIIGEWTPIKGRTAAALAMTIGALLLTLGLRAVYAVTVS